MSPWTTHLWRLLLRAYPSEFRYEYGLEMIEALAGREEGFTDGERLIPGRPARPLLSHLRPG